MEVSGNVTWSHAEPVTGSRGDSNTSGSYLPSAEFNADGINIGFAAPVENGSDVSDTDWGVLGMDSGCNNIAPNCTTCILDGFEHDCGHVVHLAEAGALQIQVQNSRGDTKWVDLDVVLGQLVTREWIDTRGKRPASEKLPNQGVEVDENGTIVTNGYIPSGYWRYTTVPIAAFQTGERRFAYVNPQDPAPTQNPPVDKGYGWWGPCNRSANDLMRTVRRDFSKFGNYSELAAGGLAVAWITFDRGAITQGRTIGITVGGMSTADPSIGRSRDVSVTVSSASTTSFTFTTNPGHFFYPGTISFSARDTNSGIRFGIDLKGDFGDLESQAGFGTVGAGFEDRAWRSFLEKVRRSCGNSPR